MQVTYYKDSLEVKKWGGGGGREVKASHIVPTNSIFQRVCFRGSYATNSLDLNQPDQQPAPLLHSDLTNNYKDCRSPGLGI